MSNIIHKTGAYNQKASNGYSRAATRCGQSMELEGQETTGRWARVTCKKCLELRPAATACELRKVCLSAIFALENVPSVGERYDQQHSDTHMRARVDLRIALGLDPAL